MTTQGLILRRLAAGLLAIACCAPFLSAQQLRVTYEYKYHPYKNENRLNADMDMTLDIARPWRKGNVPLFPSATVPPTQFGPSSVGFAPGFLL